MTQSLGAIAVSRCDLFKQPPYSEAAGALTRRFLTPAHKAALERLTGWMREAGMSTRLDAAGTLIGRYEGTGAATVLIGSHIDSVRDAGAYDGALGVMLGLGVVEDLARQGKRLPFAIEILAFGDEEGSRFHASMTGSRYRAGTLTGDPTTLLDEDGISMGEAMRGFGLDPAALCQPPPRGDVRLYLEAHIEQGPVLQAENLPLGIVTGIAAQTRLAVTLIGMANHAGTTPMGLRRDALAAAAEAVLLVERIATREGIVGTVGALSVAPGVGNVIPGLVSFSVDLRAPLAGPRDAAEQEFRDGLAALCARRGIGQEVKTVQQLAPCLCDETAQRLLAESIAAQGGRPFALASGAGHDAMSMAALCPVAMLFIRCRDGVSHNPAEHVTPEDVDAAARVMLGFLERLAAR
ncbi:allantoate amidohydrolase [Acidocella facilis]|uniref:allantoate amidohydrolase n=1 Tax=Acidocella facilis TaxID=525 RepID=UPI00047B5E8B|nr:allantoate amidohydrolase [Acidocella facilis]